jgi:uncharacterized membrane protein YqaE (UPF0057 family)
VSTITLVLPLLILFLATGFCSKQSSARRRLLLSLGITAIVILNLLFTSG